jgi:putative DNA primase/helicase
LVTINETEQSAHLNENRMKFITGHDVITARSLYQEPFDFPPTHKTFLTTNHKPIVRSTDEGTWRRIHLLPFLVTIPASKRDVNFREAVLLPELPGILNWALEGLKSYREQGLNPPKMVTEATKEYRDDMDLIGSWIDERCQRKPDECVATFALHDDYVRWSKSEVGFAISTIAFGRELADRGFEKVKVKGVRGIKGLKLLPSCEAKLLKLLGPHGQIQVSFVQTFLLSSRKGDFTKKTPLSVICPVHHKLRNPLGR